MTQKRGTLPKDRYMTVVGGYTLDMHNHGHLVRPSIPARVPGRDFGCDPLGDGRYRMVPSGDVVDFAERQRRLDYLEVARS